MAERVTIEIVGVDRASRAMGSVTSSLSRMAEIAGGIITYRLFERIASGLLNLAKQAAESYEWFDMIRFSLEEMARADIAETMGEFGDIDRIIAAASEEAERLLGWIIRLSLESPFTAQDVNTMFRLMRAYGFAADEAQNLTTVFMDFAAATGFGGDVLQRLGLALGQVRQRGRLAGEEIRQLINVGIPVRDIVAKALGVTTEEFEKLLRAGKITAEEALPALVDWMMRFDGASERAVDTWWGLVNNMKDVKELNMISFFEGIAKALQPGLGSLFDWLSSPQMANTLRDLGEGIGNFIRPLVEGLPAAVEGFDTIMSLIREMAEGDIPVSGGIAVIMEVLGLIDRADLGGVKDKIETVVNFFSGLADSIEGLLGVWGTEISEAFPQWLNSISSISSEGLTAISGAIETIFNKLTEASEIAAPQVIQDLTDSLANLEEWWSGGASEDFAAILDFIVTLASAGVVGAIAILVGLLGALTDILAGKDPAPRLQGMVDTLKGLAETVTDTDLFQGFAEALSKLVLMDDAAAIEEQLHTQGGEFATSMADGLDEALETQVPKATEAMISYLTTYPEAAETWTDSTGEQRMDAMGGMLAVALGDGMYSELEKQEERLRKQIEEMVAMVNAALEIHSPSPLFIAMGEMAMRSLGMGFESGMDAVKDIIGSIGSTIIRISNDEIAGGGGMKGAGADLLGGLSMAAAAPALPAMAAAAVPTGGGGAVLVYSPTISTADEREIATKLMPILTRALQMMGVRKLSPRSGALRGRGVYES